MKFSTFYATALAVDVAFAATCRIYTKDTETRPSTDVRSQTLSPRVARLVLAQRAGVEDFHRSDLDDRDVINAINNFGAWTPLVDAVPSQGNIFYLLEDNTNSRSELGSLPSFEVSSSPNTESFSDLLKDLKAQSDALYTSRKKSEQSDDVLHHNHTIEIIRSTSKDLKKGLLTGVSGKRVTIILAQSGNTNNADFGTYEMPNKQSQLQARSRATEEAPLEANFDASDLVQEWDGGAYKQKNTTIVRGILPKCFSTKEACQNRTNKCSGRGTCQLKYTDLDVKDGAVNKHCYACACKAEVKKNSKGGTVTTNWGGPACQKQDVSVQFWLIALFTVGLMGLISFAVGTIWSMGNEDLPSVIGAGVSGPVKR